MATVIDDFAVGVGSGSPAEFAKAGWTWVGLEAGVNQAGYYKIVNGVRYRYGNQGPVAVGSAPSSTGDGDGGGGGGGGVRNINGYVDAFEFWYGVGNVPMAVVQQAVNGMWTDPQIKQYALTHGANGYNANAAREAVLAVARQARGSSWASTLSDSMIDSLAAGTYLDHDAYLANYFVDMPGFDVMSSPLTQAAIEYWVEQTGIPLTWTAKQKLNRLVRDYGGMSQAAMTEWTTWVPTTHSAKNGNYGANHRVAIKAKLESLLGRLLTPEELSPDGPLWEMSDAALYEWAQKTPEYQAKFANKPPGVSESDYLANVDAWNVVWRQAYGIDVAAASGMPGTFAEPQLTPDGQAAMKRFGFSSFAEWEAYAGGRPGWFRDNMIASGYLLPDSATGVAGAPNELITWGYENGVNPAEWMQHVQWEQQAIVAEGTYDPLLLRTLGINLSQDDWYKYTSKAIGWGEIQLQIMEAQNRDSYREVFRNYTGRDPGQSDYDYLSSSFVSPSEYAHRMAAKESAAEMLPQANEILTRVFGRGTSLAELENLAMNGQGSGVLRAQLEQATRLEQYRWVHKQKYGTEPTPSDYARYAGYAGPAELQWELNLAENIDEFGPDAQDAWKKVYNEELTSEQLRILFGDMKGSGDLKYKLKEAQKQVTEAEQAHDAGFQTPGAQHLFGAAPQGGFREVMGGIADIS